MSENDRHHASSFAIQRQGKLYAFLCAIIFAALAALAQYFEWGRWLDLAIYDTAQAFSPARPAEDILIIDIDEHSMAELGAWPWSRQRHAELLAQAELLGIEHIAFDVIFAESSLADPAGDLAFANAIASHGGVVLPIFIAQQHQQGLPLEIPPAAIFYAAEPGIGHVHINCDFDAICRSVFLREGLGKAYWPHLALSLLQSQRHLENIPGRAAPEVVMPSAKFIYRDLQNFIAFPRPGLSFKTVSFIDVVNGYYPAKKFAKYTAFVGSTVAGNEDLISTPRGNMPGVVVNALIYQQLRDGSLIREVTRVPATLATFLFGFVALMLLARLSPVLFLFSTISAVGLAYVLMIFGLFYLQLWFPIAAIVILIFAYYPLWNWFKLQLALNYLKDQLQRLRSHQSGKSNIFRLPERQELAKTRSANLGVEVVTDTLLQLHNTSSALEEQSFFVEKTLESLAEAVLLFDENLQLILANAVARRQFDVDDEANLSSIAAQLKTGDKHNFVSLQDFAAAVVRGERVGAVELELASVDFEHDSSMRSAVLLCRGARITPTGAYKKSGHHLILNFADISSLKSAERSKLDTLNFLSHDLRSPTVSILALVENILSGKNRESMDANLAKIKSYAQNNLNYSESILQLGKAESASPEHFSAVDLHACVDGAYSDALEQAKARDIDIELARDDDEAWVHGNAELLQRALLNLLLNAIKYSDAGTRVDFCLRVHAKHARIQVRDDGMGIDKIELERIFERYTQGKTRDKVPGAGLGLYFVKQVVSKHNGRISAESEIGKGSCFSVEVPLLDMADK